MPGRTTLASLAFLLACAAVPASAQQVDDPANLQGERFAPQSPADILPLNHGAPALQQLLLKLRTRASMMMIVAHPDDEDGGLLTFESRGQGARVAMLTLTRGEGGQNLMSADFNDALGLIRTQELLAADRYLGVDQFFGTEVDFGFSKTKEEAFEKWTHDRVLYDAVRSVRLYRPLVVASVFVGGPTDGHGHHQVAGEIAQEVFAAAADPKLFPEMGLPPWTPLKVYARVPFSRVTADGMFDYATGKTLPLSFHNYVTGVISHTVPQATVLIHEGDPATVSFAGKPAAPALGMDGLSYVQFGRKGLALQKSQIGQGVRLAPAGKVDAPYTLMATRVGCTLPAAPPARPALCPAPETEASLFDGIDTSLPAIATMAPAAPANLRATLVAIDADLAKAQQLFDPQHLELAAPPLRDALESLNGLIHIAEGYTLPSAQKFNLLHELRVKRVQLNNALVLAIRADDLLQVEGNDTIAGLTAPIHITAASQHKIPSMLVHQFWLDDGYDQPQPVPMPNGPLPHVPFGDGYVAGPRLTDHLTKPYFSRPDIETPYYTLSVPALRNAPEAPFAMSARAELMYAGVPLELAAPALTRFPEAVGPPIQFLPSFQIAFTRHAEIWPRDTKAFRATVTFPHAALFLQEPAALMAGEIHLPAADNSHLIPGTVTVAQPAGWPRIRVASVTTPPAETTLTFGPAQDSPRPARSALLQAQAVIGTAPEGQTITESFRPVGYFGIPTTNLYTPATVRVTPLELHTAPGLRVAYIAGTGDDVPAFLPSLGVTPTMLALADLSPERLANFDTVVLGVRVYSAHPELRGTGSQALTDFARAGGVVVAQYDSGGFNPASAPFPYTIPGDSAHNVVVEADPVTLLQPAAPLLTWPNRISPADFDGWVEERGHGFASSWAPEYQPLLETHDPGQDPQRGGLLLAPVGKGAYVYCAFALYRQLPEAVPGAYRLLANLLSYSKNPNR